MDALGAEIAELAAHIEAADYQLILKIGEFDDGGGWRAQGAISCVHWLSWKIGLGPIAAREKVRVARALRELPQVSKAFEQAQLSYSKVRAVTRVATPESEAGLLEVALHAPAAQVEKVCRKFRSVVERAEDVQTPEQAAAKQVFASQVLDDGRVRFTIILPPDRAARFSASVEQAMRLDVPKDDSAESSQPLKRTRVDGLMTVAESFLADGPRTRKGGAPHEVRLHVALVDLKDKAEGAFIANNGPIAISADAARRICCDAGIVSILEDDQGRVLDVGRRTRTIPTSIRRALETRDEHRCRFPGCDHEQFVEAHHIEHWADGGATSLDNLIGLCWHHHGFVHEHGWTVELDADGQPTFTPPNANAPVPNVCIPPEVPSDPVAALAMEHADRGLDLNPLTLVPVTWNGEPTDYDYIINNLSQPANRRPSSPAIQGRVVGEIDQLGVSPNVRFTRFRGIARDSDRDLERTLEAEDRDLDALVPWA